MDSKEVSQEESRKREELKKLLVDLDSVTMNVLKFILRDNRELGDLENYLAHCLNTILENNRVIIYSLDRNFTMVTGTCIRNLFENWANLNYVVREPSKKIRYATAITANALTYAQVFERVLNGEVGVDELYSLSHWTSSNMTHRMKQIGDGQIFQYEILSRYTHVDMWAAINDVMVQKDLFWNNVLGWGIEAANHTLYLISQETTLPQKLASSLEAISIRVQRQIVETIEE